MSTIDYYNNNAKKYFDSTYDADMSEQYEVFLHYVKRDGKILDFGCGSGRDSLYFKNKGYNVTAIDGSEEMCKLAREYTGLDVRCMDFMDFNDIDCYDGVWACASLVHVNKNNFLEVLKKLRDSLKDSGYMFVALKNGTGEEVTEEGRYYNYLNFSDVEKLASDSNLEIVTVYMSKSVNNPNEEKYWNNFVLKKIK